MRSFRADADASNGNFCRYLRDRSGSTATFFALGLIPIVGAIGAAVEYGRYNSMRVAAQAAADAAVLSVGAQPNASAAEQTSLATRAATATLGQRQGVVLNTPAVSTPTPGSVWQVTLTGSYPSIIAKALGVSTINFSATAQATTGGVSSATPLEMALALDNTGSMSANMADLKTAASNLVRTVLNGGGGAARVSVVPYVAVVNPGLTDATSIANYVDTTSVSPFNGTWYTYAWMTQAAGCTRSGGGGGGGGSGGAGSGGTGDARDILDMLAPVRRLARELFGVGAAHAAETTAPTAPPTLVPWTSPDTGKTYTMPQGFMTVPANSGGQGCDELANPDIVSQYELFGRLLDQNGARVAWKGCVEARLTARELQWINSNWSGGWSTAKDYDTTEAPPTTSDPLSLFVPYFWPDEPDLSPWTGAAVAPGAYSSATQGFHNNYLADAVLPTSWGWQALNVPDWDSGYNLLKYDGKTRAAIIRETPDGAGFTYGPNAGCPDPVLRLTNNQSTVLSKISGLNYWQSGGTVISEGLMWAWRSLSPNAPYRDGAAYGAPGVSKVIVLMTDGVNELIDNGNNASSINTNNISDYSAYGYLGDTRLSSASYNPNTGGAGVSTYTDVAAMLDNRLLAACTNAKAAGIKIYTVVFNHAGFLTSAQQARAQSLLQQCATTPANSYLATDATSLNSAFSSIASSATAGGGLRLVR